MLDALKWQVREWERQGRHRWLSNLLTTTYMQAMNARDATGMGRVARGLETDLLATPERAVKAVCEGAFGRAIRPMQITEELAELIALVAERKPRTVIEIGTARGGTLLLLCRFAAPDATIISIDLPYGRNGGGYPRWKESLYRQFALPGQTLHLLRANSHDPQTMAKAQALLPGGQLDFLMIDGDHSYQGVRTDYELYGPMVGEGGVIALHDIVENPSDPSIDVNRFWEELRQSRGDAARAIVKDPEQGGYGLGLLCVQG